MSETLNYQVTSLPEFSKITNESIVPTVKFLVNECKKLRDSILKGQKKYIWDNLVLPIDEQEEKLNQMFSPVQHLNMVANSPELREAYEASIEILTEYASEVGQDKTLYNAYKYVYENDKALDDAQKKALEDMLKGFEHSGVALPEKERQRFKTIKSELSKLANKFENNVLDATMGWEYHTDSKSDLQGLSEDTLVAAEHKAKTKNKSGYVLGLDMPTYLAVMMVCENRKLRELFYYEYCTRASDQGSNAGKWDNSENIEKLLALKNEQAKLLGFNSYAELSIDEKMASSIQEVNDFLAGLLQKSKPQAQKELEALQKFANEQGLDGKLQAWDVTFYSEKLKQKLFSFSDDELRKYFPLGKVLDGFYKTIESIYGLTVQISEKFDCYHDDVQLLEFYDNQSNLRGKIYIDLFARDHKRGGAWMDDCRVRFKKSDGSIQTPVAYVNGNFMPPNSGKEATLTHNDVLTLFHEFGHALHHILTKVDYPTVSGINGVEWDAVELPSQFMENFCWESEGLNLISRHIETGEALPKKMLEKLNASRQFQSGMQMVRQVEFSCLDIDLHSEYPVDVQKTIDKVRARTSVIIPPKYNRFQNGFTHIFAGGYAAGYYSYKWAEVLSSDAFSKFEEADSILDKETGLSFLENILEKGGSKPAAELFEAFRGRKPSVDALLRHSGINV